MGKKHASQYANFGSLQHKIKHDKTTMQFFSLLYVLSNITTANQVFTYPRGVSGYLHL